MKLTLLRYGIVIMACSALISAMGCARQPAEKMTTPAFQKAAINETGYAITGNEKEGFDGFVSPTGETFKVPQATAKRLNGDEFSETITSRVLPIDPANKDLIYLSTSLIIENRPNKVISSSTIYSYNLKTAQLKAVYGEKNKEYTLSTVGMDGTKAILLKRNIHDENSPGPCVSMWTTNRFAYFDTSEPQHGLRDYNVPEEKITAERQREKSCETSEIKELM